MAVALAFRLAIVAVPAGIRIVQWAQGPAAAHLSRDDADRLATSEESDAALTEWLGGKLARVASVATFPGPFEVRKLHVVFGRTSGGAVPEDDALITFHFMKLAAGVPVDDWVAADFIALESAWDTAWTAIDQFYADTTRVKQLRWYRTGPEVDAELGGQGRTGPPVRVVDRNALGLSTGVAQLPAQVACTVTEKTSVAKSWGRFYLPAPMAAETAYTTVGHGGRWTTEFTTPVANAFDAFYEAALGNDTPVVVYSTAKSERPSASGGTLPAVGARAFTVDELQVDDIPDVIRSRRVGQPLLRTLRAIG